MDHLVAHSITHTVSVDDVVGGQLAIVILGEYIDSLLQRVFHLGLNDLLSFSLHDVLTVVLAHCLVGASGEADDRLRASVTHVDTDQHRSHIFHDSRELQIEQVALDL